VLLRETLPVLGVIVGALLAAELNSRGESHRWRRELLKLHEQRSDYCANVIAAVDRQYVVLAECAEAAAGKRTPVPVERIRAADEGGVWSSLSGVSGHRRKCNTH
jgi:hypothetical protein